MTKADMMASLDEVFTDRRLSRRVVEQALGATGPEPSVILDEYVALASGEAQVAEEFSFTTAQQ